MPENYVLLERTELNASAASVTFANIPQSGYTDLKIVFSARSSRAAATWDNLQLRFNGSTTSYSYRFIAGNGSAASSGSLSLLYGGDIPATNATSSTFSNSEFYIPNYLSTTTAKSVSFDLSAENNATAGFLYLGAGLWNPGTQEAINSIFMFSGNGDNFVAGSTFSLYGIAAVGTTPAIAPKASGGNIIDYDGTYWIHTFTSSGTFTPQTGLTCDYLVLAGGGGGGTNRGAGGGAGGYLTGSGLSVATQSYAITIGAGGVGGTSSGLKGSNGSNSVFSSITSTGGGGGGGNSGNSIGNNGGSGGGAGHAGTNTAGSASPSGQGNNGGLAGTSSGGGGGGAGAVGSAGSSGAGGAGGAGTASSISGTSITYAGGGGGGSYPSGIAAGGSSIGGAGGNSSTNATDAVINRGSGGGGTGEAGDTNGGDGSSGIVIIRYPAA
jgi:hypothetical protein